MADILNLKIYERSNVEWSKLQVTTLENENWEEKEKNFIYIKGRMWESEKFRVVQNIEWTNNSKIS